MSMYEAAILRFSRVQKEDLHLGINTQSRHTDNTQS